MNKKESKKCKSQVAINIDVANLDVINQKAEQLVETLKKAKSIIDELASLKIELEINS